jgi:hypothetical protein
VCWRCNRVLDDAPGWVWWAGSGGGRYECVEHLEHQERTEPADVRRSLGNEGR